jgi:hypothetical protein
MSFAFGSPLFLSALGIGAAVIAVYIFHRRPREEPVSSLLLWQGLIQPGGAGRQRERLRAPWLLALELLAIALLALAAAVPLLTAQTAGRSVIVILDDSMSMAANDAAGRSAQDRARERFDGLLDRYSPGRSAVVLASGAPALLGMSFESSVQAEEALQSWTARSGSADLLGAIRLGLNLATDATDIVVLTDHAPPADIDLGPRVRWIALGEAAPNIGFTGAARSTTGQPSAIVELTNFSEQAASRAIIVETPGTEPRTQAVSLDPGQTARYRLPIGAETEVTLRLDPPDALEADDVLTLLPEDTRPVSVDIRAAGEAITQAAERWLEADPNATRSAVSTPELLITDDLEPAPEGAWPVRIVTPAGAPNAYSGPFIINRDHELAEGLDLTGLIWATDLGDELPAAPAGIGQRVDPILVLANTTVIEHRRDAVGNRETLLSIDFDRSNLEDHIAWPVLLANAARQRRAERPGPVVANSRIGQPVRISGPPDSTDPIIITDPSGQTRTLRLTEADFTPPLPGRYTVAIGPRSFPLSALPIAPAESDLKQAQTRTVEPEAVEGVASAVTTRNIAWLLAILAAIALAVHGLLVSGIYRRGGSV